MNGKPNDAAVGDFPDQVRNFLLSELERLGIKGDIDGGGCDSGDWRDFCLSETRQGVGHLTDEIASLRSALAAAEKERAVAIGDCARYHGMFDGTTQLLFMARQERDTALAKLAAAEKERDANQAAQRSIICELQQAMSDVFCHLSPPTNRFTTWREQVIAVIDSIIAERNSLTAELAKARGLLEEVRESLTIKGAWMDVAEQLVGHDACGRIDAFLVPPADRGAEGEG